MNGLPAQAYRFTFCRLLCCNQAEAGRALGHAKESEFLDLLYGAAVDNDLWTGAMELFADMTGGSTGFLSRLSVLDGSGWGLITRIDPALRPLYDNHYGRMNPFSNEPDPRAYMETWTPRVLTDRAYIDRSELLSGEYYNDFLRPAACHAQIMVRLSAHRFEVCSLTIGKPLGWGEFDAEDLALAEQLRPHIARAFRLSEQLSDAGLRSPEIEAALDRSRSGIFVLDETGRVRRTNRMAERILAQRQGLAVIGERLTAMRSAPARELAALIGRAGAADPEVRTGGSMALSSRDRRMPLSVVVAPVSAPRLAVFGAAPCVLVCVTDPDAEAELTAVQLQRLFGFSPAEARVALALMEGATVREAAARLDLSFHTVRHHVQAMLDKSGAARQADLLALLTRAAAGPVE